MEKNEWRELDARLSWLGSAWFTCSKAVTDPTANWTQHRAPELIENNALPPRQSAVKYHAGRDTTNSFYGPFIHVNLGGPAPEKYSSCSGLGVKVDVSVIPIPSIHFSPLTMIHSFILYTAH